MQKMGIQSYGLWEDPLSWLVIVSSVVTFFMCGTLYNKWMHWGTILWAGLFTLYAFGTIITYRTLNKYALEEDDSAVYKAAQVTILLFVLVMLFLLAGCYVDTMHGRMKHWFNIAILLVTIGLLIAQLVLGFSVGKTCDLDRRFLGPALLIPFLAYIVIFDLGYHGYAAAFGKDILEDVGNVVGKVV